MRIQHNIMAMSAYRNYTNNVSAMKKNLEKLSSGYKINRAGDDAAGLAISEKMRAQITGLETAQKNAKDGISLVQTAEGALTEVHDMLNRMVELATQSANGTYDNETDRYQLQKEMDQLKSEIDRIADSSNFNGIKLLDGSMSTDANKITGDARIISEVYTTGNAAELSGTKTFLDGEVATQETKTVFEADFTGLVGKLAGSEDVAAVYTQEVTLDGTWAAADTLKIGDKTLTVVADTATPTAGQIKLGDVTKADKVLEALDGVGSDDTNYDLEVSGSGNKLTLTYTAKTPGAINGNGPTAAPTSTAAKNIADADTGTAVGTVTEATEGVDADEDLTFNFKIGGTEFKDITLAKANIAGDKPTAAEIAGAVATKLGGDGATVKINGINYDVAYTNGDAKITFTLADEATDENVAANYDWDVTGTNGDTFDGNHTAGVKVTTPGTAYKDAPVANTVFKIEASDIKDGTKITIDGTTVTLAVGKNSQYTQAANVVNLTHMEESSVDLNQAISAISKGFAGDTTNFIVGVNDTKNGDTHPGLTVHKKATSTETYDTKSKLAGVFSLEKPAGNGLTLQIGDTADTYNQLKVSISDCHSASLGLSGVDISTQEGAQSAVDAIKAAINKVSDVRGTLGATQNRLDHTINNLSVMTENIQDAESTIRDVDVAEEMMAYTKNNILIQSAQAMLAQANQVPQGVLQLLG